MNTKLKIYNSYIMLLLGFQCPSVSDLLTSIHTLISILHQMPLTHICYWDNHPLKDRIQFISLFTNLYSSESNFLIRSVKLKIVKIRSVKIHDTICDHSYDYDNSIYYHYFTSHWYQCDHITVLIPSNSLFSVAFFSFLYTAYESKVFISTLKKSGLNI